MVRNSVLHLFILLFAQSGNGFQIEIAELDFIIEAKNNAVVFPRPHKGYELHN